MSIWPWRWNGGPTACTAPSPTPSTRTRARPYVTWSGATARCCAARPTRRTPAWTRSPTCARRWKAEPMATIKDIVVDCHHPASLARFWAAALDGYAVAPYDEAELARLRDIGILDPEDDPSVLVEAAPGVRPRFFFQLVPEPKVTKNRVH